VPQKKSERERSRKSKKQVFFVGVGIGKKSEELEGGDGEWPETGGQINLYGKKRESNLPHRDSRGIVVTKGDGYGEIPFSQRNP